MESHPDIAHEYSLAPDCITDYLKEFDFFFTLGLLYIIIFPVMITFRRYVSERFDGT